MALLAVAGGYLAAQDQPEQRPAFQWLETNLRLEESRPASALLHPTHQVHMVSLPESLDPRIEVEEEVIEKGPASRRIDRRVYQWDETGRRRLVEQSAEVQTVHADGRQAAEMTVSRLDANGRLLVVERRTQQTRPTGAGAFQTESTHYRGGSGGALEPHQFIRQTERKLGGGRVEVEKTQYGIGGNRNWEPIEQRQIVSRPGAPGEWTSEEEVFRREHTTALTLSERSVSREWKDGQGRLHRTAEFHRSSPAGRLSLDRRMRITVEELAGGGTRAVQETERRNPVAPMEGVRIVERLVETVEDLRSGGERRKVEIHGRNANGGLAGVAVWEKTRRVEESPSGLQSRTRTQFDQPPR